MARRDEIIKDLHVGGFQRLALRVTAQQQRQGVQRRQIVGEQFGHGNRGLQNQWRMNHVAEIQNSAKADPFGVDQEVMTMAIAVNRLTAQCAQSRHALLERRGHLLDPISERSGIYIRGEFHEFGKPPDVPRQALRERGMEEALQCAIQTREGVAEIAQQHRGGSAVREQFSR